MAGRQFSLEPKDVPRVKTRHRAIKTKIPAPETVPMLEKLRRYEPVSMSGQPPILWDRAEGFAVWDKLGNKWLDFSSGVLVANAGHARKEIAAAAAALLGKPLLHTYCFPNAPRAELAEKLIALAPAPLKKVFILTTGAETTENAIKLARTHGVKVGGRRKIGIVTFQNAFHGRTLGAQMAGGIPSLKEWIVNLDPAFVQVPFPGDWRVEDKSFDLFLKTLKEKGLSGADVAGVMTETYQGGGASFAPAEYVKKLRGWCDENKVLLIFDEVQAGFGRCGTMFGFEHYGVVPDIACLGKGITSSLPLSAVIGREDVMGLYGPGEMTSTHTGNPVICAMAAANIDLILKEKLVENAAAMGEILHKELSGIREKFPRHIGALHGKGLVAGLHMTRPGTKEPDADAAWGIVGRSFEKGLLMFSPVGFGGATVKIAPPLCITREAVEEGVGVLEEALRETVGG